MTGRIIAARFDQWLGGLGCTICVRGNRLSSETTIANSVSVGFPARTQISGGVL